MPLSLLSFSSWTTDAILQQGFPQCQVQRCARLIQGSQFHKSPKSHQQFWLLHWAGCDVQLLGSLDPQRLSQSVFSSKGCSLYGWPLLQTTQPRKQHLLVPSSPNYLTIGSISDMFSSLIPALTKQRICACVIYELCQCFVFFQVMGQNVRKILSDAEPTAPETSPWPFQTSAHKQLPSGPPRLPTISRITEKRNIYNLDISSTSSFEVLEYNIFRQANLILDI